MKIYKLEHTRDGIHCDFLRLVDVLHGTFRGFSLDKEGVLTANFAISIGQEEDEYRFAGDVALKEGESFSWPEKSKGEGNIKQVINALKLVKVDANDEDIFTLYNGVEVPRLGFGTWLIENEKAKEVVKVAVNAGYIHIDSAQAYGNEEGVGIALKNALFHREDIFITSKVKAEIKDYEGAKRSIEESLEKLGTDYIDMMLIHCPMPWNEYRREGGYRYQKENLAVWKALEEAYEAKKIRSIGVSNFNIDDLKNMVEHAKIKPMVNQIPLFLGDVDKDLVAFCNENEIMVESYSPLAHGRLLQEGKKNEIYNEVTKGNPALSKYNWSQLLLSYASTYADIILPKASSLGHILEDMDYQVKLDKGAIELIEKLYQE